LAGLSGLKKAVDDAKKGAGAPQAEAPGYKPGTLLASMGGPAPEALAPAPAPKAVAAVAPPPTVPTPPKANGHSAEEEAPAPAGKPKSHGKRSKSEAEEKSEESGSGSDEEESSSSGSESSGSSSSEEEEEAKPSKASEKSSKKSKKPSPSRKAAPKEAKKDNKKEAKKVRIEEPKKAAAAPSRLPSLSDPMPSTAKQVRDLEAWFASRRPLSIDSIQTMNALDKSLQGLTINLEEKGFTCQWRMDCSPAAITARAKALSEVLKANKDKDQATILGKYLAVLGSDKRKNFDIWHKTDTDHVIMATDYRFDEAMQKPELAAVEDAHLKVRFYLSKGVLKQAFGIKARSKGGKSGPAYTRTLWNEKTLAEDAGSDEVPKWIPDTLFYNTSVRGEGAEAPEDGMQITPPAPEERATPQKSSKRQRTAEAEEKQKPAAAAAPTAFLEAEIERMSNRSAAPMEGVVKTLLVELHATRLAVDTLASEVMKLAREIRK
jgi:hypothetical protein